MGMDPATRVSVRPKRLVSRYGMADATTAPRPMKMLCMANPLVRWSSGSISATKARNGSMLMLMDASRIQSSPAAIHSTDEFGMKHEGQRAEDRACEEVRTTATQAVPGVVAHVADDGLHDQSGERRGQPQDRDLVRARSQVFVDGAHVRHLESPAELNAEEPEAHVPDLPKAESRFGHSRLSAIV